MRRVEKVFASSHPNGIPFCFNLLHVCLPAYGVCNLGYIILPAIKVSPTPLIRRRLFVLTTPSYAALFTSAIAFTNQLDSSYMDLQRFCSSLGSEDTVGTRVCDAAVDGFDILSTLLLTMSANVLWPSFGSELDSIVVVSGAFCDTSICCV